MRTREQIIADALRNELGVARDNLYRFRLAARGRDTSKQWDESGKTLADHLAAAQSHVAELEAAIGKSRT